MSGPLLGEEEVLALLDTEHTGWKSDREGWVTLELRGVTWRVHYRRGRLLEIGWWGLLDDAGGVQRRALNLRDAPIGRSQDLIRMEAEWNPRRTWPG